MRSWLRSLARSLRTRPARHKNIPSRQLRLEVLEDRTLPASLINVTLTGPSTVTAGATAVYVESITNSGPSSASSVTFANNVPSGASLAWQSQVSGPAFTLGTSGGNASDTISSLPSGATAVFDIALAFSPTIFNGNVLDENASASLFGSSFGSVLSADVYTTTYTTGPISFFSTGTQSSTEGGSVSLSISASDATFGTLKYAAAGLPPGLAINPSSGAITGTVALGATAASPYSTTVTASDGTYSASETFTWNVSQAVTLTNPGTQTSAEGATPSLSLSASDSTFATLFYSAVGLPPGLKINTGTGAITGTVGAGVAAGGPYNVTATAADGTYSASKTFTWNVTVPITMVQPLAQTSTEGDSASLSISASGGGTLVYTATGLPAGLSISTSTGAVSGTVASGDAALGLYGVTVTAGDGNSSASQSFTWNVNDPISIVTPANQTNNEGDTVSLSVSASDSSGGTLTYGAVGLPGGLSVNASTGAISGTVSVGAAADGPYSVTLLAEDGTYFGETSFTWNVNSPVSITTPADQTNNAGDTVSLAINASGSGTLSYSATGLPAGLAINSSTGAITGTISDGGSFQPTVTVGNGTYSAAATFSWTVGSTITITDDGDQAFNAGDTVSVPITATDTAAGTLTYSASGLPSGTSINSSTGVITGTLSALLSPGVTTSTITVTDGTHTAVDQFAWTVYGTSTVVVTNPGAKSNAEGDTPSLSISTSYSGGGTLKYAADGLPAGLKINPGTGAITGTVAAGDAIFAPYTVTVTASDGSNSDSQSFTWNVGGALLTLSNPGDQSSTEGGSISLTLSASYSGVGSVTYAALGLPPGLVLNSSTGAITGTMGVGAAAPGPHFVSVFVTAGGSTVNQDFT